MICIYCKQEMEYDCTENIGYMDQCDYFYCQCGATVVRYEADREPEWTENEEE